jgi:IrrE N-terminal-like domain
MGRDPNQILLWEDGTEFPSYTSLEDLAYRYLKIPLAVFFFPDPPDIEDPKGRFRRLPDYELARLSSDTFHMIQMVQGYQESLAVLQAPVRDARKIFHVINARQLPTHKLAEQVRQYLELPIERQFAFQSAEQAFKAWRYILEQAGVFTFKDSLADKFVSGFSLLDDNFPVIFVNNSNTFTRQTFTLAHELGHILYGIHGVTDADETYFNFMSPQERSLEISCNRFAAELLVPEGPFQN